MTNPTVPAVAHKGAATAHRPRIVSLIASATEIIYALGLGEHLLARSHECDWPPEARALPPLTRSKVRGRTSFEIDRSVKGLIEQGLAVYEVDAQALEALRPEVIVTQDHCEVCAVSLKDVERAVCAWVGPAARIVSCRPYSLEDVYGDIRRIAAAAGVGERGEALVADMGRRFEAIRARTQGRKRPRMVFIEWIEPAMTGGHWTPALVEIAGGEDLLGQAGHNSPWVTWASVAAADPDVIVVAPCGYDLAATRRAMQELNGNDIWAELRAVREGNVFVADGNAYFNRPGPRLVETAEMLAEILHPDVAGYGHRGQAFQRWGYGF